MIKLGYKLMSEEHGPADLVRNATRAEQAGFDFAAISDHFFPWLEEQGHAPFAWSVLGAVANATRRIGLMTAVTCPIMRYHPAIIARAQPPWGCSAATGLLWGSDRANGSTSMSWGAGWPGTGERHERLSEATDIIQGLLTGKLTHYRGRHFQLDDARLFDRPDLPSLWSRSPPAAPKRHDCRPQGGRPDGDPSRARDLIEAFVAAGGSGPRYAEVALCYSEREADARETAHRYFRWSLGGWPVQAELPNPAGFAAASAHVSQAAVAEAITCGPSRDHHLEAIDRYAQAGFDHIVLVQIGPEQDKFIEFFERELAPALRVRAAA
ncbi:MAG: TIGR03557 family F420-dependent LLM class oxidoreductase [Pseudomonadota bacterium]